MLWELRGLGREGAAPGDGATPRGFRKPSSLNHYSGPAMELRNAMRAACCALALAAAGCGASNDPTKPGEDGPDPNDKRAVALQCITGEEGLEAQISGEKSIQVGTPPGGPRVEFFLSTGEAESQQFKGAAQEAEQVGTALVFVNQGSDEDLESLEKCLQDAQ